MKILYIFCSAFISVIPSLTSFEIHENSQEVSRTDFKVCQNCRRKRGSDREDVINRFEMERVSPLYDILRHLPPFEDGWLSDPVTSPSFPKSPLKLNNESSSFGEFKIEVSKDEEHVVSESGRQFKENSALNWYYSAESYSSVGNFSNANADISAKTQIIELKPNTNRIAEDDKSSDKSATLRRQDEDHVVSHVPGLKGGRGAFIDFNLLESSTTPKVDSTLPPKAEDPKPNITTRYILLQSGRIVAINVTSVASVLKPTSSSGSSNKNPFLPTFYFGSRIRNKNGSKTSSNITITTTQTPLTTIRPAKLQSSTFAASELGADIMKEKRLNAPQTSTVKMHHQTTNSAEISSDKKSRTSQSIKPNIEYSKSQQTSTIPSDHFTFKPNIVYTQTKQPHQSLQNTKSQQLKESVTTNFQQKTEISSTTKYPFEVSRETSSLDPAQRWWKEMTEARRERLSSLTTTVKPNIVSVTSSNLLKVEVPSSPTVVGSFDAKKFDSMKKSSDKTATQANVELNTNTRSAKHRTTGNKSLKFSTLSALKAAELNAPTKIPKTWTTTFLPKILNADRKISSVESVDEDLLEPSGPLSEIRHEFVRIASLLPPPVTQTNLMKSEVVSNMPAKNNRESARRPRYRGLSHVNLQAPKGKVTKTTTAIPKQSVSAQPLFQLNTASHRWPSNQQMQHWWTTANTASPTLASQPVSTAPPLRSRHGFYLRNSVTFQTIPNSLTDRRTLNNEAENLGFTTAQSLQPQLEDFLIISFEPTRKSMGLAEGDLSIQEKNPSPERNTRNNRPVAKKMNASGLRNTEDAHKLSTVKPQKNIPGKVPDGFSKKDGIQSRVDTGNRMGRHFRNNNSRHQSVTEKPVPANLSSSTTKKPFRVYYFEPKRKKSKTKNETADSQVPPPPNTKPPRNNSGNSSGRGANIQNNVNRERTRNTQTAERPNNARSAKQLQISSRQQSGVTETTTTTTTTAKPAITRVRSSPFIWHRPNVGTMKTVT